MPVVGEVAELWLYPFKSMQGGRVESAELGDRGFSGDRAWSLRYAGTRKNVSAKQAAGLMLCSARQVPGAVEVALPDGSTVVTDGDSAREKLRELVGSDVTLDSQAGAHFDDFPVHLLTTASLETLSRLRPESAFDVRRFRPNVVVKPLGEVREGFVELGWLGFDLRVGEADLLVKKPCRRCVMTTHEQAGLPKDPSVLQTVVDHADASLGVYCSVLKPGAVKVGDPVVLL